jgi:hypothetical protein
MKTGLKSGIGETSLSHFPVFPYLIITTIYFVFKLLQLAQIYTKRHENLTKSEQQEYGTPLPNRITFSEFKNLL